jgi:hypothetical protein
MIKEHLTYYSGITNMTFDLFTNLFWKKYFILICIMLAATNVLFAQFNDYKNQVKFVPIRTFDILNPGIEFSYQHNYGNFATQFSAAYLTNLFYPYYGDKNVIGIRLGAEEKYYLPKLIIKKIKLHISVELAYHYISYLTKKDIIQEQKNL